MGVDKSEMLHQSNNGTRSGLHTLCFVQQAATKFKKSSPTTQKISREKRELLKKIKDWQHYRGLHDRFLSELQELVKPFTATRPKGSDAALCNEDDSDDDNCTATNIVTDVLSSMQGTVDSFCEEVVRVCCDRWEVDKMSYKFMAAKENAAKLEKENRESHLGFMKELQLLKDQVARLQNRDAHEVSLTQEDVIFFEATRHLDDEQRRFVKEIVEYKVKAELDKVANGREISGGSEALLRRLKEQEKSLAELQQRLAENELDSPSSKQSEAERLKMEMRRTARRMSCPAVARADCAETELGSAQKSRRALLLESLATRKASDASDISTMDSCTQTVSLDADIRSSQAISSTPSKRSDRSDSKTSPWTLESCTESSPEKLEQRERRNNLAKDGIGLLDHLAHTAKSVEVQGEDIDGAAKKFDSPAREMRPSPTPLRGGLTSCADSSSREQSQALREKDEIIEQLRDKVCMLERAMNGNESPLESALAKTVQDNEILSLRKEVADKTRRLKEIEEEGKHLKEEVQILRAERPSDRILFSSDANMLASSADENKQAAEEIAMLRKESQKLADELQKQQQANGKLEISLNEIREKMKRLLQQLKEAGLGSIVDRIFETCGLSEFLQTKKMDVFERLYSDAMVRVRKSDNFQKVTSAHHAQALLSTIQSVYGDGDQGSENTSCKGSGRRPSNPPSNAEQSTAASTCSLPSSWRDLVEPTKPPVSRGGPACRQTKASWRDLGDVAKPAMEEPSVLVWSQKRMSQSLDSNALKQAANSLRERRGANPLSVSSENEFGGSLQGCFPKRFSVDPTHGPSMQKACSTPTLPRLDSPSSFRVSSRGAEQITSGIGCSRPSLSNSASATMLRGSFLGDAKGNRSSPRFFVKGEMVELPGNCPM